jgi:hypothetical protein
MPAEIGQLYGRAGAVELTKEFLSRPQQDGAAHNRRQPVLVFTGPPGSGKTALLDKLAEWLQPVAPYARIDCAADDLSSSPRVLSALVFELNRTAGGYGRLAFPRFITGQLVLRQELVTDDRARACGQVSRALAAYRNIDALRDFLVEVAGDVETVLHHGQPVPGARPATKYAVKLVLQGLIASRLGRRVLLGKGLDWYGHQGRGLHLDPLDVLVDLNVQDRHPEVGDNAREVSALLWAAFLADLRDDFQAGRHAADWPLNCVILVDNADAAGDSSFLDELITARRRHAAHSPADPDPLTVLAASRGALSARVTAPGDTVAPADQAGYQQYLRWSGDHRLPQWWYPVRLRELTDDEVGNMVAAIGFHGTDQQLVVPALYRFTSGHLGSVHLVVQAMAAAPPGPVSLPGLLARRAGTGRPTLEDELLGQFLPGLGKDTVDDLVTCAAAWDIDRASRLARHGGLLVGPQSGRSALFAPELWVTPDTGGAAVLLPVLRRLLLRRLAARRAGRADWATVHAWFRDDSAKEADEAGELYYALALGEVVAVSRRLASLLPGGDAVSWLRRLHSVSAAPNKLSRRPGRSGPGQPGAAADRIRELTSGTDPRDVPLAPLARLVAALWIAADPLFASRKEELGDLYNEIQDDFDLIAPFSGNGLAVLRNEAARYRALSAGGGWHD